MATIVFLPVSSAVGTGEFMRCVLLAHAVAAARPATRIVFGVSVEAEVPADFPFVLERLPASPTKSTPEVLGLLARERPAAVLWDNSGRAVQFKAARRLGARTIFLSVRPATRRKGFKLQRLLHTDELWLVDALRPPTGRERLLLRLFARTRLRRFDALLTPPDPDAADALLATHGITGPFTLLVATSFREWFGELAAAIATDGRRPLLCVGGEPAAHLRTRTPSLRVAPLLPNATLMALIERATLVVSGTGHIAEQVACFGTPLVAVTVTPEQRERAGRLAALGVAVAAPQDVARAAAIARALAADTARLAALREASQARGLRNGLPAAAEALVEALDAAADVDSGDGPETDADATTRQ
jgi:hypothetical protein